MTKFKGLPPLRPSKPVSKTPTIVKTRQFYSSTEQLSHQPFILPAWLREDVGLSYDTVAIDIMVPLDERDCDLWKTLGLIKTKRYTDNAPKPHGLQDIYLAKMPINGIKELRVLTIRKQGKSVLNAQGQSIPKVVRVEAEAGKLTGHDRCSRKSLLEVVERLRSIARILLTYTLENICDADLWIVTMLSRADVAFDFDIPASKDLISRFARVPLVGCSKMPGLRKRETGWNAGDSLTWKTKTRTIALYRHKYKDGQSYLFRLEIRLRGLDLKKFLVNLPPGKHLRVSHAKIFLDKEIHDSCYLDQIRKLISKLFKVPVPPVLSKRMTRLFMSMEDTATGKDFEVRRGTNDEPNPIPLSLKQADKIRRLFWVYRRSTNPDLLGMILRPAGS